MISLHSFSEIKSVDLHLSHSISLSNSSLPHFEQYFIINLLNLYNSNIYKLLYHSTIFRTIDENVKGTINKYGIGNASYADIANAFKSGGISGATNSALSFITSKDLKNIKEYNKLVSEEGVSSQTAWYKTMQTSSSAVKELFDNEQNLVKSGNSVVLSEEAIADATNTMTIGAKAGKIALKGLAMAGNMLLMWGISEVISGIVELATYSDKLADKANELGNSFKTSGSDIDDYKTRIQELQDKISDSSTSYNDVVQARKDLMTIQDELIDKYGSEEGAIRNITDAVNGQTDALDKLTNKQYEKMVNKFNDTNLLGKIQNFFAGGSNLDQAIKKMELYSDNIKISKNNELNKYIESIGGKQEFDSNGVATGFYTLSGTLNDVYDKLLSIQSVAKKFGEDDYSQSLSSQANKADELIEKYQDMYDAYILQEKIFNNDSYTDSFNKATEAYKKYQKSIEESGQDSDEAKKDADEYYKIISEAMQEAFENGDTGVVEYFKKLYPALQTEVSSWEFKAKVTPILSDGSENPDYDKNLDLDMKKNVSKFKNAEEILNFNREASTDKSKNKAYDNLLTIAHNNFQDDMEALVNSAIDMYNLETQGEQDFIDRLNNGKITNGKSSKKNKNVDDNVAKDWYNSLSSDEDKAIANSDEFIKTLENQSQSLNNGKYSAENYANALKQLKGSQELYSSFDCSELGERMDYLNQKFSDGEITVKEYFDALRNEIENTDFSEFTNEAAASQQFFTDSLQDLAGGLSNVINDFDSGQSSITEYLEGYLSIADTLSTLTDDLQENSSAWNENGESISDATSEMLDGAQSGLSSAIENVRQYQDSIYSLEQIMNGAVEEGTDEFTAHSQVIAEDLAHIVSTGGQMADEVKQYLGSTTNEIAQSLTDNVDNQSIAAQAIAANTNTAIADMATNVGKIFDTLGNAIKNFNVDITFSVKEFSLKKIAMGLLGKQELPEIKFGISASGNSLNTIGDAVSSLGKSISTNLAPQQIELPDFKKVDDKYTPNAKVLDNYNNKLDDLKNKTKKATDALKKQKEALEDQKDVLEDTKDELETLADAIAWFYDNQIDKIDKQIDKLNDANDALNDQKDTYDDILDAIDKVYEAQINAIQERIDALDEANDEEEKALELEKARQALEDARHKKNIKVYAKGKGFVYTVDESAIKNAEDDYNKLVDEMQKDEIKKALEDQIEALNKLRDTFADIPNAWKDAMNKLKASEMFGSNWEIDILNPSDDLINNFRNQYTGTQDQIQSNENKIDSLEAEKERIEELKQLWEDAKNAYKYSQYEAKLSSFFGSDYEYQLLNNSAAWRGKFIEEYSSVCAQIEALEQQIKNLENESAESASSAADSTSEALGKTSNAIRDASNTAKDNSIGKYLWGQEDDAALTAAKLRLMDLNDQLSKGANDDLVNAKNAVQNFITEWANLKNTGEVTDGLTQSINNLQIADGDYFEKYGNVIGNVKDRLSESAQYTNNAAQCVKDASGNIELLNQQLATLNTSTDNVEATADQAVSDTGVTIDGSLEKITALKDAMGELVTAKAELQSAIDESVTDVSDVITASGDKVTTIQDQVTVLLDNIDRLNDAMANLADKMSTLDDVTLDSVCNALGAADGSTGLIGSINSVITAINGENGLIVQLGAVNTASLEEITLGFGSEDGVGLLGAVQNVNNAIYVEDSEECLIGKINKIAETITTIDSASNAFLIMRANILLAEAEVQKLIDLINSIPEEKHTYHYIHTVNVGEATGTALTGYASGTATPSGSSYVRGTGNWGLPQDEKKAAVAEIGREILLRDGQYFVIDKPQLMDLKKGDIIFNHAQTESILKNGKNSRINEFAKLGEPVAEKLHKQGNSFTDGTLPKGWRKVDIFEDLRNSGAVYDMDKFDAAVMKMKTDPESIKTMMYNPNNMPDWNKFVSSGQTVNTTNNNQQTSVTYQFNGDLSFPNITNGDDAKKFINEIQHLPTRARQYVNRH